LAGQPYRRRPVPVKHGGGELPERRGDAAGRGGDRAEVQHAEPAAREQQEVAGVQVGVHPPGARRGRVDGVPEQPGGQVRCAAVVELAPALRQQVGAPVEQRGQGHPVQPAGDQHPGVAA
jgi:hypothetical protein